MHYFGDGFLMGFGGFWMLLWLMLIVGGIVLLLKLASEGRGRAQDKPPLEILKERYARGEIDQEEYQKRRADLED